MSYDQGLAQRIREQLQERTDMEEKKMFGGLCYMVSGHMCCGLVGDTLMARVGTDVYERCLSMPHVNEMDFTGRPMKGFIFVAPDGLKTDVELEKWVGLCLDFVESLKPRKQY